MNVYEIVKGHTDRALKTWNECDDPNSTSEWMLFALHALGEPLFSKPRDYWNAVDLYDSVVGELRGVLLMEYLHR